MLLLTLACSPAPVEDATGLVATCVGAAEVDRGLDGGVDAFVEERSGDGWITTTTQSTDGASRTTDERTFDADGRPLTAAHTAVDGDDVDAWFATWARDAAGVLVEYVVQDTAGTGYHERYTYEGGALARMERTSPVGDALLAWETYTYDADGRPIERRGSDVGVITTAYFDAAPSLDARTTQDYGDDGSIDTTEDAFYDDAGRLVLRQGVSYLGSHDSLALEYGATDEPVYRLTTSEYPRSGSFAEQEWAVTSLDGEGRPWVVDETTTWIESAGAEAVVTPSRTVWSWDCEAGL